MSRDIATPPRFARIGPRTAGALMSAEEFDSQPGSRWVEGYRYELINGVLVVSPAPLISERDPNEELGHLLRTYRDTHPAGGALDATVPEQTISVGDQRRRADRAIWAGLGRVPDLERDLPGIVVEFVSSSRKDRHRDYVQKRAEYLGVGVVEYWVIDRFQRTMTAYVSVDGVSVERLVRENDSYETPLLPGFSLPLARLLSKADLWTAKKHRRKPHA
jgi:Uma2 family endonuclease